MVIGWIKLSHTGIKWLNRGAVLKGEFFKGQIQNA